MTRTSPPAPTSSAAPEVIRFLEGPQTRDFELARAFRIFLEFVRGFRSLHFVGPCVTVFGSARFRDGHPYYGLGREVGAGLARAGFTVMTSCNSRTAIAVPSATRRCRALPAPALLSHARSASDLPA